MAHFSISTQLSGCPPVKDSQRLSCSYGLQETAWSGVDLQFQLTPEVFVLGWVASLFCVDDLLYNPPSKYSSTF